MAATDDPLPEGAPAAGAEILDTSAAGPAALRGSALRTAGYAAGVLLSLASAPLLIRHLGVEDFGRYVTVLSIVTLAGGITEAGLNAIALREYASRDGAGRAEAMRNLVGIRLVLTAAGVLGAVGFALAAGYDSTFVLATAAAGAAFLVQVMQTLYAVALQGNLRFGWITAAELLRQVLAVAGLVVLVIAGAGLVPFLAIQIPAAAAALCLTVVLVRRLMPLRPAFDRSRWWPLLRDTVPFAIAVALHTTYFRIAIILMSLIATELETGYFATSFRVVEVVVAIPPLVIGAAFPILARAVRDDSARFEYASGRILELALIMGVLIALPLALGAASVMHVLGGADAEPSTPVLRIQSGAIVLTFLAVAASYVLLSLRRHRPLLIANLAALSVAVGLVLALAPGMGAEGAAIATVAGELALAGVMVGLLASSSRGLLGFLRALPAIAAAAGAAALVVFVPGPPPWVDAILAAGIYVGLLHLFGRFPPEVRDALRGRAA
ncbi:MAG TPA: oligosaccharide flippase family protein [Thermoleophilaceae bacterium]|nr:oligosaccharide flippase family protein [Thermoleophilaceae bacterium]